MNIKKFILGFIIVFLSLFVLDLLIGSLLGLLYKKSTTVDAYKMCSVAYSITEPVVFMGSSRCHHTYVPSIISDSIGKGVYNAGLWGMRNIYFQYGLLCNMLERYTPETICLEYHPADLLKTSFSDWDRVASLGPFINVSEGCDEVLKEGGYYYKFLLSHIYRYNSELPRIVIGNIVQRVNSDDLGYMALTKNLDTSTVKVTPEYFPYEKDESKALYFKKFIDKCREKGIQLIIIQSAAYLPNNDDPCFSELPSTLASENGVAFINDYVIDDFILKPEFFSDAGHFNDLGARKFSSIIASQLKQYIK